MATTYAELDINQKIQTKAAIQTWAKYSVQHFQEQLDKKVYGLRTSKKGIQRSSLSKNYKFGSGRSRTNSLRRTWWQNVNVGSGVDRVMIQFLMYGRFLDMGVGKGTSALDRQTNQKLRTGNSRVRRAWYSKRKTYEIKRLREILAKQNINLMLDTLESALSMSIHLNL